MSLTGFLRGRGEYDWVAGGNSPIERNRLLSSGNWKELTIPNEIQFINAGQTNAYDSMLCVSFNGTTDAIEYIKMQQLRLGMIPGWKVNWLKDNGYFENGVLNFNEIYVGILGETTIHGAYVYKVADAMRKYGLVPQKAIPFLDNFNDNLSSERITPELLALGKKFIELFPINYEWIPSVDTEEFMQYSPLGCFGFYGNPSYEGEIIGPTSGGLHSMLQVRETDEYREIDDSYWQQFKKYKKDALDGFMAFYVNPKDNSMFNEKQFIKDHDTFQIQNSETGAFGVIYRETPMEIIPERAGLYLIDRDARGLLGKGSALTTKLTNEEWKKISWVKF